MCATGNPIGAKEGFDCGLIDRLIEGELIPHAVAFAEEVRDVRPLPKSCEREDKIDECDPAVFDDFPQGECAASSAASRRRSRTSKRSRSPARSPMPRACIEERKLFMELMSGTQAKAQQYFFFAERKAAKIDGLARRHPSRATSSASA